MDKKKLGMLTFLAGLTVGAATTLLNKQHREVVKDKATVLKNNTTDLGGKVKDKVKETVDTIGKSVEMAKQQDESKDVIVLIEEVLAEEPASEVEEEMIPEQLDIAAPSEKEADLGNDEVVEEGKELLEGNSDILLK